MKVNLVQLLGVLEAHKGAVIIGMISRTDPPLLARSRADKSPTADRYPEGVQRLAQGRYMLNNNYGNNVQAQRTREDHPEPEGFQVAGLWEAKHPPCNGDGCPECNHTGRVPKGRRFGRFLVVHVDKPGTFYLRCRPASDGQGFPVKIRDEWKNPANDTTIEGEELDLLKSDYLKSKPKKSVKQQLDREIPYRTVNVDGVLTVTVGGTIYELDHAGDKPNWLE